MHRILVVLFAFLLQTGLGAKQPPPPPEQWLTDGPQVLTPATRTAVNQRLAEYEKATGHQVLVWIGESTQGEPIETWAVRAFAAWKVGRKGLDDGLVLFLFSQDRKLRIEVGYGLEGQLPDIAAAHILNEAVIPALKQGDWDSAVTGGVSRILQTLGGETNATQNSNDANGPHGPPMGLGMKILLGIVGLAFLVFFLTHPLLALALLFNILSGGRGGGFSGGGGGWSGGGGRSGGGGASGSW